MAITEKRCDALLSHNISLEGSYCHSAVPFAEAPTCVLLAVPSILPRLCSLYGLSTVLEPGTTWVVACFNSKVPLLHAFMP